MPSTRNLPCVVVSALFLTFASYSAAAQTKIFTSARTITVGSLPNSDVVADFNKDGIPDLAITDDAGFVGAGFVEVLLGRSAGGFAPAASYAAGQVPEGIAVGDFNGDAVLDLAVADESASQLLVLLGNGDGTFQSPLSFAVSGEPSKVSTADFNKDGILDLVASESSGRSVDVLIGKGDGSFGPPVQYAVNDNPSAIAIADVNGDGKFDLAVANGGSQVKPGKTVSILLGNGDGTFQRKVDFGVGDQPCGIAAADFNKDGKIDLATANFDNGTASVLIGNGDGTFQNAVSYIVAQPYSAVDIVAVKFSNQDNVGLAVGSPTGTYILAGNGDGSFSSKGSYAPRGSKLAVGDFNRDGKMDLAVIVSALPDLAQPGVAVLLGSGGGVFQAAHDYFPAKIRPVPDDVAEGDFNEDGKLDLVTANSDAASISVLLNLGNGQFGSPVEIPANGEPFSVKVGDLNRDGHLDLAVANLALGTVTVLTGDGKGNFGSLKSFPAGTNPYSLTLADLNSDGILDLAVADLVGGLSVLLGKGDGTFQSAVSYAAGSWPDFVAAADLNGDGKLDLVATDLSTGTNVMVLLGNGDGTFKTAVGYQAGQLPRSIAIDDFNGDHILDLAIANSGESTVSVLAGNGDGTFKPATTFSVADLSWQISTADFDGDGNLDLATANEGNGFGSTVSILRGNGHGQFSAATNYVTGLTPETVLVGDFDSNGGPDLAVLNSLDNTVTILFECEVITFADEVESSSRASRRTLCCSGFCKRSHSSRFAPKLWGADQRYFGIRRTCSYILYPATAPYECF